MSETYKITNLETQHAVTVTVQDQEAAVRHAKSLAEGRAVKFRVECLDAGTEEPTVEFVANRWR